MLLDVAVDLDAEAEAIEAKTLSEQRAFPRQRPEGIKDGLLHTQSGQIHSLPVQIVNMSLGGAKIRADGRQQQGDRIMLEVPSHGLRLNGTILRVRGSEAAVMFDAATRNDPRLNRLLRPEPVAVGA